MRLVKLLAPALVAALVLSIAGCGTTEPPKEEGGGKKVTVTDSRGKQTLDGVATRVVALEWALVEDLLAVGVQPVGVADVKGYNTWVSAEPAPKSIKDVGLRQEVSIDSVAELNPDLILGDSTNTCGKTLKQFQKIADTLCFDGTDPKDNFGYMQDQFTAIAKSVGKEKEAEKQLDALDAKIADGKKKLAAAGMSGKEFAGAHGWTEKGAPVIRMFGKGSLGSDIAEQMGMKNGWKGKTDEWGLSTTDVEGMTKMGDVHLFYIAPVDNIFKTTLPKNRIWQNLTCVEKKQVYQLDGGTWLFGGPSSASQFVDELVKAYA
ncbi:MAG: ABC transporter substrate-binding protein [Streptosporangiales bacterium]|nr:ABC transporter substrate-binding protein [Streptosporangiales bacterium]